MPLIDNIIIHEKKDLHIFYIIDTSASMYGEKIEMLNEYMDETIHALKEVSSAGKLSANIKVAVMEYNNCPRWVAKNGVEAIDDFTWSNLEARGTSRIVPALRELNSKLNIRNFMGSEMGAFLPIIIFVTGGTFVDYFVEVENAISELKANKWFQNATKFGVTLDKDADVNCLLNLCGNLDCIFSAIEWYEFKNLLAKITLDYAKLQCYTHFSTIEISKTIKENVLCSKDDELQENDNISSNPVSEGTDSWCTNWTNFSNNIEEK